MTIIESPPAREYVVDGPPVWLLQRAQRRGTIVIMTYGSSERSTTWQRAAKVKSVDANLDGQSAKVVFTYPKEHELNEGIKATESVVSSYWRRRKDGRRCAIGGLKRLC